QVNRGRGQRQRRAIADLVENLVDDREVLRGLVAVVGDADLPVDVKRLALERFRDLDHKRGRRGFAVDQVPGRLVHRLVDGPLEGQRVVSGRTLAGGWFRPVGAAACEAEQTEQPG